MHWIRELSQWNRQKQICLSEEDCEGIANLMHNGFSFQETLLLLESKSNQKAFQSIREHLESGDDVSGFFNTYLPKSYRLYFSGFIHYLNFSDAINLTMNIVKQTRVQKREYVTSLFYPSLLFLVTVAGLILFNEFCFPALITMMHSFHVEFYEYIIIQRLIRYISFTVLLVIAVFTVIVMIFASKKYRLRGYSLAAKYFPHNIFVQYTSQQFIVFFQQCVRQHISTKETLEILETLPNNDILVYLASTVKKSLLSGESFVSAICMPLIDTTLYRFIKISVYASNIEEMLSGYLEMSKERIRRQAKKITKILQLISYATIGFILILVYQVLMMPLQILQKL